MTQLTPPMKKFILHWGEMGTKWGINRTVAQVHALLYISPEPLNAEDIAKTLGVARSNVSTSLKELQGWGIVKVVHAMGDRRDHFESLKDVWQIFHIVLNERKRREVDPTITILRDTMAELGKGNANEAYMKQRLHDMLEFFETGTSCYQDISRQSPATWRKLAKMGGKIQKLLGAVV